jgi:hypothetical protein
LPRRRALRFHGADDVRGFVRIRQAGRAGARADAGLIEEEQQRLGLDVGEGDTRGVGEAVGGGAVALGTGDAGQRRGVSGARS